MELYILAFILLFLLGIAVGSFINAFEYRIKNNIDFVKKRSMCPKCKHVLSAYDLIPLISFFMLKGKCRHCETRVSWQYPVIEAISGSLFIIAGGYFHTRMQIVEISSFYIFLLFSIGLGCIFALFLFFALYDVKHQIVPNKVVIPSIILMFIINILLAVASQFIPDLLPELLLDISYLGNLAAGLSGGVFIFIIIFLSRGKGMGGGDLKLMVLMGLLLGIQKLVIALYLAVIIGSILGLAWGLKESGMNIQKIRKMKLPFALFLSIGTILAILYGDMMWSLMFGI